MEKRIYSNKKHNNDGFTLLEVLLSILILSIITTSVTAAFVYAARVSRENKLGMTAMNIANASVEYIRSLDFALVGTKTIIGGTTVYGDPSGDILQTSTKKVDGVEYIINTVISWETQGGWSLGTTDWDFKSVKVTVYPTSKAGDPSLTKVIETYVSRDSTQPLLTGANISLRLIRGWNTTPGSKVPVAYAKVRLSTGPSAPRQVQTTTAGLARFINLTAGNYKVIVDPGSLGMILQPDQAADWALNLTAGITQTKEIEAEYPCSLRIALKDLDGKPLQLGSSVTGAMKITVPFGAEINKNFSSTDIDASTGYLPDSFITGLWPVGDGYSGTYSVSAAAIKDCQYFGSYETIAGVEALWSGKFDAPGTCKYITCYFGTIPITPSYIDTEWADTSGMINSGSGPYTAFNSEGDTIIGGKFATSDPTKSITMPDSKTSDFNATEIYFENTGSGTDPGLYIKNRSMLVLNTGKAVFRGTIKIQDAIDPSDCGRITLSVTYTDGTDAPYIDGSRIGKTAGVKYGKVYFAEPMVLGGSTVVEPGGYYFYNGLELPGNVSDLIPITKENYVN